MPLQSSIHVNIGENNLKSLTILVSVFVVDLIVTKTKDFN